MAKLVTYVIMLILVVFARITISDDSSSSYYSWNYGGVSSNDVDASSRGYESPALEENQYDTPPSSEGDVDSTNTYYESQYAYPPNTGADNSSTADDTYASPSHMSSAPSSLETMPNNSSKTYKDELTSSSSYDDSSTPQSDSSSSSSYYDSSTPQNDVSSSSSYNDSSTPQSDPSSSLSYDDSSSSSASPSDDSSSSSTSSSSDDTSSSSSSSRDEDPPPTTTDESQSGTEERYNSVEEVGSGVDGTEIKTEHLRSKAGLVFGVLIGVCAVGAAGFIYIKKKRESYPNTNRYISLTKWDRI